MKSKSYDLNQSPSDKTKHYDFVNMYKSAAETNIKLSDKHKSGEGINKENSFSSKHKADTSKRERSLDKNKKKNKNEPLDVSQIHIDGHSLDVSFGKNSLINDSKTISTPDNNKKSNNQVSKVKSIMKNTSLNSDDTMDESNVDATSYRRKKRNKSVSFMLDDTDELVVKKTKSDDSLTLTRKHESPKKNVAKKAEHSRGDVKHNKANKIKNKLSKKEKKATDVSHMNMETDQLKQFTEMLEKSKPKGESRMSGESAVDSSASDLKPQNVSQDKKKKFKKIKKQKSATDSELVENESTNIDEQTVDKDKKLKKKKRHVKTAQPMDTTEGEEPKTKARKKEVKPEIIEDLENLSIGDNAHTLTSLLDEMTVADKNKKKSKHRSRKDKKQKTTSTSSSETADLEKIEEGKEKVKWKKRKWNKDKKGEIDEDSLTMCVVVENIPLSVMLSYKKLLTDHFTKFGLVKKIGIAEVYPTEEPKPVFTTTVTFYSVEAAMKALEEDNMLFEGSRIRVKRPLPPTQTTLVVRSYADLSEQNLSSIFTSAGRIRSIRHLVKGKKFMATAFIEFDGPKTVEKALKLADEAKIGGKKIHVSKFEQRRSKNKETVKSNPESENEGGSEDSND